jgi:hypothetical protein
MSGWVVDQDTVMQIIWITGFIFTGMGWCAHWIWESRIRSSWYAYLDKKFPKQAKGG